MVRDYLTSHDSLVAYLVVKKTANYRREDTEVDPGVETGREHSVERYHIGGILQRNFNQSGGNHLQTGRIRPWFDQAIER